MKMKSLIISTLACLVAVLLMMPDSSIAFKTIPKHSKVILSDARNQVVINEADKLEGFNSTMYVENDEIYILDNEIRELNLTIIESDPGWIHVQSTDRSVFIIVNQSSFEIPEDAVFPLTFKLIIKGKFLGIVDMNLYLQDSASASYIVAAYLVKCGKANRALNDVFTYALLAWLAISYITMGTKMDLKIIWGNLRRPVAVLIGMGCQFLIMPALAFGISKLFVLDDATAVGLILDGTCPGGWFSNIFSLLLDCDVVLSLTMTFMSTFLAIGMMPLNLLIYADAYTSGNSSLDTPFVELFIQMLLLLIPVGIGMALTYKFEKLRKLFEFLLKPFAIILLLIALGIGLPSSIHVFLSPWQIWVASAMFPVCGSLLGFFIAKLCCLENRQAVTVGLETGAQNSLMARTMIDLFYPLPESDLVGRVPTLISLLTMFEGIFIVALYVLWKRFFDKSSHTKKKSLKEILEEEREAKKMAEATIDKMKSTIDAMEKGNKYVITDDQLPIKKINGHSNAVPNGNNNNNDDERVNEGFEVEE